MAPKLFDAAKKHDSSQTGERAMPTRPKRNAAAPIAPQAGRATRTGGAVHAEGDRLTWAKQTNDTFRHLVRPLADRARRRPVHDPAAGERAEPARQHAPLAAPIRSACRWNVGDSQ